MVDGTWIFNEKVAHELATSIESDVVRNLVIYGIAEARMKVLRSVGQDQGDWRATLPEDRFDMLFFARVLRSMFTKTDIVRAVLDGRSLAEASGWNIEDIPLRVPPSVE